MHQLINRNRVAKSLYIYFNKIYDFEVSSFWGQVNAFLN